MGNILDSLPEEFALMETEINKEPGKIIWGNTKSLIDAVIENLNSEHFCEFSLIPVLVDYIILNIIYWFQALYMKIKCKY